MEKLTVTIAVHNSGENFDIKLTEIYNKAKQLFETTGYDHNYFAYISSNFKSGKVIHIKNEKRLKKEIEENYENVKVIELYSLIDDFKQAAFDYNVYMRISRENMMFTINKSDYSKDLYSAFVSLFKNVYHAGNIEVFELDKREWPLTYVCKDNDIEYYKTLVVLEKREL